MSKWWLLMNAVAPWKQLILDEFTGISNNYPPLLLSSLFMYFGYPRVDILGH
jgi:hypothetical protein